MFACVKLCGPRGRILFIAGLIISLIHGIASVLSVLFIGSFLNQLDVHLQASTGICLLLILLVLGLSAYFSNIVFSAFTAEFHGGLLHRAGNSLAHMQMRSLEKLQNGDVLTRTNSDLGIVSTYFQRHATVLISGLSSLATGCVLLFFISWEILLVIVLCSTLFTLITLRFGQPLNVAHKKWREAQSEVAIYASDIVAGQQDIKSMGLSDTVLKTYQEAQQKWIDKFRVRNRIRAWQRGSHSINSVIVFVCVPVLGAIFAAQGIMQIGTVFTAVQMSNQIASPIMNLDWWFRLYREMKISLQRVKEIIEQPMERENGEGVSLEAGQPLVEFEDVSFSYGISPVLRGVSLRILPGEHVAIVGESGSGKTTLLRMIAGLYTPDRGVIRFGGMDIARWDLESLRSHLSLVDQETYLYPISLRNNITCGMAGQDLEGAVRKSLLENWVKAQREGLDTMILERGANLSGGLKQRISIARALWRSPSLFLFDEPTSALNSEMETELLETIKKVSEKTASVTIAHRLYTIMDADKIYALKNGQVIESGTHKELMEAQGYYYTLYMSQRGEIL